MERDRWYFPPLLALNSRGRTARESESHSTATYRGRRGRRAGAPNRRMYAYCLFRLGPTPRRGLPTDTTPTTHTHTQKACHPAPAGATKTQRPLFPDYESPCPHSSIYTLSWNDLFIRLVDPAWVQSRPVGRAGGGDKCMHAWSLYHSHSLYGYPEGWALCGCERKSIMRHLGKEEPHSIL